MVNLIIETVCKNIPKLKNPILVEGLPGIGNVGKIAADFLVDTLKPKLLYKIYSFDFSHIVYLNDNHTVELPWVGLYWYGLKGNDLLILAGDEQPTSRRASYEFCNKVLDIVKDLGCTEIITLGGVGLPEQISDPKVFGAVTSMNVCKKYRKLTNGINFDAHKRVDMIIGVSGLLLGLGGLRGMNGIALLTETYEHRAYMGLKEAGVVLEQLKKILKLNVSLSELDKEIASAPKCIGDIELPPKPIIDLPERDNTNYIS